MQCGRGKYSRSMYTIYIIIHNALLALTMVRFPLWPCTKMYRLRTVWAFLSVLKENLHPFTVQRGVVGSEVQVERERERESTVVRCGARTQSPPLHDTVPPPSPATFFF